MLGVHILDCTLGVTGSCTRMNVFSLSFILVLLVLLYMPSSTQYTLALHEVEGDGGSITSIADLVEQVSDIIRNFVPQPPTQ